MAKKFKGIGCPCITPFAEDGSLDLPALQGFIDFQINNEIAALILAGTCGEAYTFNESEFQTIIDAVIDHVNEAVPVYLSLPSESSRFLLKVANYAVDAGVDGFLLPPPYIPTLTPAELVAHFEFVSSQLDSNVLVVNDPDNSGIDLTIDQIVTLSKLSNVVGLVELSSDFNKVSQINSAVSDVFLVYSGRGLLVPQAFVEGRVEGAIVPSANVVPNLLVELYGAFEVDMKERFEEIQQLLIPLEIGLKLGYFPATLKASLNLMGFSVGKPRPPLQPLTADNIEKLRNILVGVGCLRPPAKEDSSEAEDSVESSEKKDSQEKKEK